MSQMLTLSGILLLIPCFFVIRHRLEQSLEKTRRLTLDSDRVKATWAIPAAWFKPFAALLPARDSTAARELQQRLIVGGYQSPTILADYRAIRGMLVLMSLLITGILASFLPDRLLPGLFVTTLILVVLAFSLPRVIVELQARARCQRIAKAIPAALDLLAISLGAGIDQVAAASRVSTALKRIYPDFSDELQAVHVRSKYQPLDSAWRGMSDRVPIEEIRSLTSIFVQSSQTGADVASALNEYANSFRENHQRRAEKQANLLSFWMLFPTISCLFTASIIMLVAPPVNMLFNGINAENPLKTIQRTEQNPQRDSTRGAGSTNRVTRTSPPPR